MMFVDQLGNENTEWILSDIQFSRSVVSDSATPWTTARQASLSITNSWSLLKLMSILGQEDPLEKEMATQYSCLGNPMDRGAWWATIYEIARVGHD